MSNYRILWVVPYFPWPVTSGGMARQDALLRAMSARGHFITLLSLVREPPPAAVLSHVEEFLDRVEVAPRRPPTHIASLTKAVFSLRPTITNINAGSPLFSTKFANLLQQNFDVIQIEHSYTLGAIGSILQRHDMPFILTEHNIESEVVGIQYARLPKPLRAVAYVDSLRVPGLGEIRISESRVCSLGQRRGGKILPEAWRAFDGLRAELHRHIGP